MSTKPSVKKLLRSSTVELWSQPPISSVPTVPEAARLELSCRVTTGSTDELQNNAFFESEGTNTINSYFIIFSIANWLTISGINLFHVIFLQLPIYNLTITLSLTEHGFCFWHSIAIRKDVTRRSLWLIWSILLKQYFHLKTLCTINASHNISDANSPHVIVDS